MAMSLVSLANACRLCLKVGVDNFDIFVYDREKQTLLKDMWRYFCIRVEVEDFFPKNICPRCVGEIDRFSTFCEEVEKVQKRMRNLVACIPADLPQNPGVQDNIIIPDLTTDSIKVEPGLLDVDTQLQSTAENKKPVAYGVLQMQSNNPNPVMLIVGDNPLSGANLQPQFVNASSLMPYLLPGGKLGIENTTTDSVSTQIVNPNPTLPLLVTGSNSWSVNKMNSASLQTQLVNPAMPLLAANGNIAVQNNTVSNTSVQPQFIGPNLTLPFLNPNNEANQTMQLLNTTTMTPFLVAGGNSGVQSSGINNTTVQTSVLKSCLNGPVPATGMSNSVANPRTQTSVLKSNILLPAPFSGSSSPSVQTSGANNTTVQSSVLKPNHFVPIPAAVSGGSPGVQLSGSNNTTVQTSVLKRSLMAPVPATGVQNSVANNTTMQTSVLKSNFLEPVPVSSVQNNAANKATVQTSILKSSLLLPVTGGNPGVKNSDKTNSTGMQISDINPNPLMPVPASGSSPVVQNSGTNNSTIQTSILKSSLLVPVSSGSGSPSVQNSAANGTTIQTPDIKSNLLVSVPVSGGSSDVLNSGANPVTENSILKSTLLMPITGGNSSIENSKVNNITKHTSSHKISLIVPEPVIDFSSKNKKKTKGSNLQVAGSSKLKTLQPSSSGSAVQKDMNNTNVQTELLGPHPLAQLVLLSGSYSEVQNKNISSTNTELSSEDSHNTAVSNNEMQVDVPNNTEGKSLEAPAANEETHSRDIELASFFNLTCSLCTTEEPFKKYELLDKHSVSEHGKKAVVMCCDKEFVGIESLLLHMHKHKQRVKCPVCGKELYYRHSLKSHMVRHLPQERRPFKCKKCGKGFAVKVELQKHEEVHLSKDKKTFQVCDVCGKKFSTLASMLNHQQYYHKKERTAMCHICAKTFSTVASLKAHFSSHNTKSEWEKCSVCGKGLKNKMTLRAHMRLHSKQTYPCPHCDKVCRLAVSLREHLRCHQNLWPHQCCVCSKLFKRKAGLQAHMVVHTGEKPYQCPFCPRTFASKSNYYSHKLRMHVRRMGQNSKSKSKVSKKKKKKSNVSDDTSEKSENETENNAEKETKSDTEEDNSNDAEVENKYDVKDEMNFAGLTKDIAHETKEDVIGSTKCEVDDESEFISGDFNTCDMPDESKLKVEVGNTNE